MQLPATEIISPLMKAVEAIGQLVEPSFSEEDGHLKHWSIVPGNEVVAEQSRLSIVYCPGAPADRDFAVCRVRCDPIESATSVNGAAQVRFL
jgi:hypothetical protein